MQELAMSILGINSNVRINHKYQMFSIETIIRETKTLWVTNKDTRINKESGCEQGSYIKVRLATPKDFEELEKVNIIKSLRNFDFSSLDLETLKQIKALIKE